MSLQTRVKALETDPGGADCPECGWDRITPLELVFERRNGDGQRESTYCGMCGRPIHILLTWGGER